MKYYLIAGERSGDLHAGNLVKAILKYDPVGELRGIGGSYMEEAGVTLSVNYSELAFMGFVEVIKNWNTVARYTKKSKNEIIQYKPDVVILVDYGGFNMRIASFCKENNIRVFYYITPKVWAWYQRRALKLKRTVDRMFVILPFEKDFFKKYDWDVDYVGNPVWDAVKSHEPKVEFLKLNNLRIERPIVALLPGSRKQELMRMIPVMTEVVKRNPDVQFGVAVINALDKNLYGEILQLKNVRAINEDTYNLLLNSTAAIVTSGTATLETALFKVPQVVIYKASESTYRLVKLIINVTFISLVNLIAGKEVIRELIQKDANPEEVSNELVRLMKDTQYRNRILSDYQDIIKTLDTGSASDNAGRLMVSYLKGTA
jgi:lipid-A-disaccharide synthase